MATIKDIADRLGIAPSTVSKGLNDANDISPDLKQLVLDTAIEMGYVTKKMKKETRKRLCIFIENMLYLKEDDFGFDIVLGFRQAAIRDKWDVHNESHPSNKRTLRPLYDAQSLSRRIPDRLRPEGPLDETAGINYDSYRSL